MSSSIVDSRKISDQQGTFHTCINRNTHIHVHNTQASPHCCLFSVFVDLLLSKSLNFLLVSHINTHRCWSPRRGLLASLRHLHASSLRWALSLSHRAHARGLPRSIRHPRQRWRCRLPHRTWHCPLRAQHHPRAGFVLPGLVRDRP